MQRKKKDPSTVPKKYAECERLNITLPVETSKKLNTYLLAVVNKRGKIPHGIKTKIGELAVAEWLEKYKDDTDILFS